MSKDGVALAAPVSFLRRVQDLPVTPEHLSTGLLLLTQVMGIFSSRKTEAKANRESTVLRKAVFKKVRALKADARKETTAAGRRRHERQIQLLLSLILED
jgi:hypothetical protein